MDKEILRNRIRSIRVMLKKNKLSSLLVTKPANVTYTTGFLGDDSWVLIVPRAVYLLTDSRYTEQAKGQCPSCKIIERTGLMAEAVAKLLKKLKLRSITLEDSTSLANLKALKKDVKARFKTSSNIIETIRSKKDKSEVASIKAAARIAAKALKNTLRFIKPGTTEGELAVLLDFQIRKLGARNSFETVVAFGANSSRPHHQPTNRKLKRRDTVLIDFGVRYRGYCCDVTRCFAIGKPSAFYQKVYEAVQQARAAAMKKIKASVDINEVDSAARDVIRKYNLPVFGHGTGHGLGLEIHELPIVSKKIKGKLEAGNVITIEPAVYILGKLGVRIEDDVLVTKAGCKILSQNLSKTLVI